MQNFTKRVNKLQQEINDISFNINKVKNKSHRTMSSIVEKLKFFSENTPSLVNNTDAVEIDLKNEQNIANLKNFNRNNYNSNIYNHNDIHFNKMKKINSDRLNSTKSKRLNKSANYKKHHKNNLNFFNDNCNDIFENSDFKFRFLKDTKDDNEDINYISDIKNNTFNKQKIKFNSNEQSNSTTKYSNYFYHKNYKTDLKDNSKYFQTKTTFNNDFFEKETLMNNDTENNDIKIYNDTMNQTNKDQDKDFNIVKPKIFQHLKTEIPNINNNIYDNDEDNIADYSKIISKTSITNNKNKTINNTIELAQILKLMNVKNIDDAILKLKQLKRRNEFYNKIKNIFYQNDISNNNSTISSTKNVCEKILSWVKNINSEIKEIENYENFCKNIMRSNDIKNFNQFKIFINEVLSNMEKNEKLIEGMKQICQNESVPETINVNGIDTTKNISQNQSNSDI